jgi:mannose-6-phosphate isomerase
MVEGALLALCRPSGLSEWPRWRWPDGRARVREGAGNVAATATHRRSARVSAPGEEMIGMNGIVDAAGWLGPAPHAPLPLAPNRVRRAYRGGALLDRFRGAPGPADGYLPEDWVGSVTPAGGPEGTDEQTGLSVVDDGKGGTVTLRELVRWAPAAMLGPAHLAAFGPTTGVLVKLLDPAERLHVHAHPDRAFARAHLGSPYGKTEAWIVLGVREGVAPEVRLGLREAVSRERYRAWIERQEVAALLDSLHRLPVQPGDVVFVPAGTPHAIGAGLFIVELQEPTDFSIVAEWRGFPRDPATCHLGLDWDRAIEAFDLRPWSGDELCAHCRRAPASGPLLGEAVPFFAADAGAAGDRFAGGRFAILIVTAGTGALVGPFGELPIRVGTTLAVPAAIPEYALRGDVRVIRCLGPDPSTAPPTQ